MIQAQAECAVNYYLLQLLYKRKCGVRGLQPNPAARRHAAPVVMITVVSNMTPRSTLIMPSLTLKPVQYVAITFLVDNSIEWLAGLKFTLHPIIEETCTLLG